MSSKQEISQAEFERLKKEGQEFIEYLSIAIDDWCGENGIKPKNILRDELEIPRSIWESISAGNSGTQTEYYARIFRRTGIPQSDPRSIPDRARAISNPHPRYYKEPRAWTEKEYQDWMMQKEKPESDPITEPENVLPSEVDTAPHPIEDMSVPQTHPTTSKGAGKTFRGTTQQLFDQFLESFVSMVLPKNIDPNDSRSVEEMTSAMIRIFGKLKKMTEEDRTAFANTHGRQLTLLLPFIEAYTLPEKSRREQALSMIMGFNAQGQFNQE